MSVSEASNNNYFPNSFIENSDKSNLAHLHTDWLLGSIKDVLAKKSSEVSLRTLRPEVKSWIHDLNGVTADLKKKQVTHVLNWIINEPKLSIRDINIALYAVEKICLSRRITTLGKEKLYSRIVDRNIKNRVVSLEGLKNYISFHYADLPVFYISQAIGLPKDEVKKILKEGQPVWIVMQHGENLHKTLFMVSNLENDELDVHGWDSLGITPNSFSQDNDFTRNLNRLLRQIQDLSQVKKINYFDTEKQQNDSTNCGTFVIDSLENALTLLKQKKPLFSKSNGRDEAHPIFFESNQCELDNNKRPIPEFYLRNISEDKEKKGNCKVQLIAAHLLKYFLHFSNRFVEPNHSEPGDSDTDKEDEDCVIM
jgi:hypothetical protein